MKKNLLKTVTLLMLVLCSLFSYAATKNNTDNDKEYFSSFRKNEEPKNKSFSLITQQDNFLLGKSNIEYYTIYKEDSEGKGYYFKVVVDKISQKPVATYIAEDSNILSEKTKKHLIYISKEILHIKSTKDMSLAGSGDDPAICVIKCHRANDCYGKPTSLGASLCSADCHLSCHKSTSTTTKLTESIQQN